MIDHRSIYRPTPEEEARARMQARILWSERPPSPTDRMTDALFRFMGAFILVWGGFVIGVLLIAAPIHLWDEYPVWAVLFILLDVWILAKVIHLVTRKIRHRGGKHLARG